MATFKISEEIKDQIYFQGRIFWEEDMAVMGYTNTSFTVHFKGTKISALLRTGVNEEVNYPAVRVYVDGAEYPNMLKEIILAKGCKPDIKYPVAYKGEKAKVVYKKYPQNMLPL